MLIYGTVCVYPKVVWTLTLDRNFRSKLSIERLLQFENAKLPKIPFRMMRLLNMQPVAATHFSGWTSPKAHERDTVATFLLRGNLNLEAPR